jgi:arylsulfatase A
MKCGDLFRISNSILKKNIYFHQTKNSMLMLFFQKKNHFFPYFISLFILSTSLSCKKDFLKQAANNANTFSNASIANRPNIILILGDDIGYEVPGYTGGQYITPNINNLAANGLQFTHCYGAPMCSPSRFMLMTGKYNFRNYFASSWGDLGLDQKTIGNMLHDAGYRTCVAGKWQFNNGDSALKTFGFDKYCVTNPFKHGTDDEHGHEHLYKEPAIYENGNFLPQSEVVGKYGEDMFFDYLSQFIDSNRTRPFFIYWAPNLCHRPFCPTPDDPQFATWDPNHPDSEADSIYFPSMVKYFDKDIGKLLTKLNSSNLQQNTIILFLVGDNGTDFIIKSLYNGKIVHGGKGHTTDAGIHLPFIAYAPGIIKPGVNTGMVDFVDFLPTISKIANIPLPKNYGTLDGINFYRQLAGSNNINARKYSYCYYDPNRQGPDSIPPSIWSLDTMYKVYDGINGLYNYATDPDEQKLISGSKRTPKQIQTQTNLQNYINSFK